MVYRFFTTVILLAFLTGSAAAAGKIILVGAGAPEARDVILVEHLEALGFTVEPHAHDEGHPVDLSGVSLVFISETTTSGNITGAYKDSTVPVVNSEGWTYDDMGFVPNDTGLNSDAGDSLTIVRTDHPITQGFSGQVRVYDPAASLISAGNLEGDFDALAVRSDNESLVAISVYESGAQTVLGQTQARHVNIFGHGDGWASLTNDGWELTERAVLYAVDQLTPVEPSGKLAVRWADIKAQSNR